MTALTVGQQSFELMYTGGLQKMQVGQQVVENLLTATAKMQVGQQVIEVLLPTYQPVRRHLNIIHNGM